MAVKHRNRSQKRKKVNFMIDMTLLSQLKALVPEGDRSDFVNEAMRSELKRFGRRKALENIETMRKEMALSVSTEDIIAAKNYGRK